MTAQISNLRIPSNFELLLSKQIEKASPNVNAYAKLLKFQNQSPKNQLLDPLKLSQTPSSQNPSSSSKFFAQSFTLNTEDQDSLDCKVADLKLIREIFDREGRLVQLISSDGSINYKLSYDENITTIVNQINGDVHIQEMDNQGRLIREVFPCGLEIMFHFDGDYLSEVILPDQSKVVYQYTDQNHVVVQRVTAEGIVKYQHTYSQENEMIQEEMLIGDCGVLQRVYDENSRALTISSETLKIIDQFDEEQNLLSRTFQNASNCGSSTTIEYSTGDLLVNEHRQLDDQGGVINYNGYSCSYDDQGRLIQKTSSKQVFNYDYDALDRLVKVAVGGKIIEYTYDVLGRRLTKAVTTNGETNKEYYLYQGVNQIGVYNELNKPIHLRALGVHYHEQLPLAIAIESNDQTYAPIFNSNLNIVQLVDIATKEVFDYQNLSPFGDDLQNLKLVCPWIFAAKFVDADTGLVDFGNRQYDPTIKQWITKDNDPRATVEDFYVYCNNNPLKFMDPDGRWRVNFSFAIPFGIGAARGAAQGAAGGIWGVIAGALIGAAAGLFVDAAQKKMNDKNRKNTNRDIQQDQFDDAIKEIERQTGKKITKDKRRELHDHITGQGYGYHEIVDEGIHLFDDSYKNN